MPTYDYECTKCGHTFEEFQAITEAPRSRCPQCRGKVQRLIGTGAGIVFRGSGWYVTDSRRGAGSKATRDAGAGGDTAAAAETAAKAGATKHEAPAGDAAGSASKPAKKR